MAIINHDYGYHYPIRHYSQLLAPIHWYQHPGALSFEVGLKDVSNPVILEPPQLRAREGPLEMIN